MARHLAVCLVSFTRAARSPARSAPTFSYQSHFGWRPGFRPPPRDRATPPSEPGQRTDHRLSRIHRKPTIIWWMRSSRRCTQLFLTDHTLTGSRTLCVLNGTMVGLIADIFLSSQRVLTVRRFRTTSAHCDDRRHCASNVLAELALRQLPCGGWAALASSSQPAIEPTCYAALALGSAPVGDIERAQDFLLRTQNPNGSWPVVPGDDQEGGWVTSLAVIALRDLVPAIPARLQGFHWVLNCSGKESNWFWKWKFRTADRHVRFNPDKYG